MFEENRKINRYDSPTLIFSSQPGSTQVSLLRSQDQLTNIHFHSRPAAEVEVQCLPSWVYPQHTSELNVEK